jgi:hypothetical protein
VCGEGGQGASFLALLVQKYKNTCAVHSEHAAKGIWGSGIHKIIREVCVSVLVHLHSYSLAMLFVLTQVCKKMKMKRKNEKNVLLRTCSTYIQHALRAGALRYLESLNANVQLVLPRICVRIYMCVCVCARAGVSVCVSLCYYICFLEVESDVQIGLELATLIPEHEHSFYMALAALQQARSTYPPPLILVF